jgi:hypothetical protein
MSFAVLCQPLAPEKRGAEYAETPTPTLMRMGNVIVDQIYNDHIIVVRKVGICHSAPSALVPLDKPFVEGVRYREAGATDARNRLDLYLADESGPWLRKHGVLLAQPIPTQPPAAERVETHRNAQARGFS